MYLDIPMKNVKLLPLSISLVICIACGSGELSENRSSAEKDRGAKNTAATPAPTPPPPVISVVDRPQKIADLMSARGDQDAAAPVLKIVEPKPNAVLESSTVRVNLALSGDLKGYKPGMNEETHTGNHIHLILDNQPYEAYYNLEQPFEMRNVMDGDHTLRVFPSRPWHESFKNEGAFQSLRFSVKNGGANPTQPTTVNGQPVANPPGGPEGKDVLPSNAGKIDFTKPLLTYSRPKGEYKDADADAIMIDFWISNAKLSGDGGIYQVKFSIDGGEPHFIDRWVPIWTAGWPAGKHSIKVDLVDKSGNPIDNGGYNSTTRDITITK
jgi:hypothetical protein